MNVIEKLLVQVCLHVWVKATVLWFTLMFCGCGMVNDAINPVSVPVPTQSQQVAIPTVDDKTGEPGPDFNPLTKEEFEQFTKDLLEALKENKSAPAPAHDDTEVVATMQEVIQSLKDLRQSALNAKAEAHAMPKEIAIEVAAVLEKERTKTAIEFKNQVGKALGIEPTPNPPDPGVTGKPLITIYSPKWCNGSDCKTVRAYIDAGGDDMFEEG